MAKPVKRPSAPELSTGIVAKGRGCDDNTPAIVFSVVPSVCRKVATPLTDPPVYSTRIHPLFVGSLVFTALIVMKVLPPAGKFDSARLDTVVLWPPPIATLTVNGFPC